MDVFEDTGVDQFYHKSSFVINYVDYDVSEYPLFGNTLHCFTPLTTSEVCTIILQCPNKS